MFRTNLLILLAVCLAASGWLNYQLYYGKMKTPYGWVVAQNDDPVIDAIVQADARYKGRAR